MDYAVIEIDGRQIWVENGLELLINRLQIEPGESIAFKRILMASIKGNAKIGKPYLDGSIIGQVVEHVKGPKLNSFKMKSKKKYQRKKGHRQSLTKFLITDIII